MTRSGDMMPGLRLMIPDLDAAWRACLLGQNTAFQLLGAPGCNTASLPCCGLPCGAQPCVHVGLSTQADWLPDVCRHGLEPGGHASRGDLRACQIWR